MANYRKRNIKNKLVKQTQISHNLETMIPTEEVFLWVMSFAVGFLIGKILWRN